MKTSNDGYISFYPDNHKYRDSSGKEYLSVTTALKRFFPFDQKSIAEKVSNDPSSIYYGRNANTIVSQWDKTSPCGTALHSACERWITTGVIEDGEHREGARNFAEFFDNKRRTLKSEKIVYDKNLMIAGTLDCLEATEVGYDLWDIKSCRKIDTTKLLEFSMQIELYRRFAESNTGTQVCTRGIIWFENYFTNRNVLPCFIQTLECSKEVNDLIHQRKTELLERE